MKRLLLTVMTMILIMSTQLSAVGTDEVPSGIYPSEEVTNLIHREVIAIYPAETSTELHSEFLND
jgi:hypothetical protein